MRAVRWAAMRNVVGLCLLAVGLVSCAAPKPILYPNQHYKEVGQEVAERDIDDCSQMAKDAGATQSQGKRAKLPATRRQVEQSDQRRVRSAERSSDTRAAEPWWEPPAARRPDFFEVCSGALHPVRPTSNSCSDVLMSAGTIRSVGSKTTGSG